MLVVFVDEFVAVRLISDYFDVTVLCLSSQNSGDAVCTVELFTVLIQNFEYLPRRHRLFLVCLLQDRPYPLEFAST